MSKTIEKQVLELIKLHNPDVIKKKLTLDTDLSYMFRSIQDDADEFITAYFDELNIETENFNFLNYFPNEGSWFIPNRLLPQSIRPTGQKAKPLTVRMLLKSAKVGR